MNDLLSTELFSLLTESSQEVTNEEMEYAYENFVKQITILHQSNNDNLFIIRKLNYTRIEFVALESLYLYGQGKKCAKNSCTKSNTIH